MANKPNTIEELSYKLINIITLRTAGWEVKLENCLEDYRASLLAEKNTYKCLKCGELHTTCTPSLNKL